MKKSTVENGNYSQSKGLYESQRTNSTDTKQDVQNYNTHTHTQTHTHNTLFHIVGSELF